MNKISLFSILLLLFTMHTNASAGLINNGSFEQNTGSVPDFWTTNGIVETSTDTASDGLKSVRIGFGNGAVDASLFQSFTTVIGTNYALNFDLTAHGGTANTFSMLAEAIGTTTLLSETVTKNPPLNIFSNSFR